MKGNYRSKGFSQIISTVIITSILLTTISLAIFYASTVISASQQQMEYASAKDTAVYLADAIEQVAFGTGNARMIKISLSTVKVIFLNHSIGQFTVRIGSDTIINDNISAIIFQGGEYVTTSFMLLRPSVSNPNDAQSELTKLIVSSSESLVIVYENFTRGAKTFVYSPRVRVAYLGVIPRKLDNNTYRFYNFFEVTFIRIYFKNIGGSGTINIVARNMGLNTTEIVLPSNSAQIECVFNGATQTMTMSGYSNADGSIILVRIANIMISTR